MRKLWMFIGLFLLICLTLPALAQAQEEMSREETREWKRQARQFRRNPEALRDLVEGARECDNRIQSLVTESNQLKSSLAGKDQQLSNYEEQIADLNQRLLAAQNTPPPSPPSPLPTDEVLMGIVFRVQLGAYEQTQMEDELITTDNLAVEETNGVQKVVVGQFRNYVNAKALRDRLRQMGVSDAWIVSYQDGRRISVEEALRLTGQ